MASRISNHSTSSEFDVAMVLPHQRDNLSLIACMPIYAGIRTA